MSVFHDLPIEQYNGGAFNGFVSDAVFSMGTARSLVWLSQLAYETHHPEKSAQILGGWGLTGRAIGAATPSGLLAGATTRGVVAEHGSAVLVAIAGTDVLVAGDYVTDATFRVDAFGTHQGFKAAADAIWRDVRDAGALARETGRPLLIGGHSLGGAIATILAEGLLRNGLPPAAVYTFGMPRPGNARFACTYNTALGGVTYRLVHGEDPIPTIPPYALGYWHVGRMLGCTSGGAFQAGDLSSAFEPNRPALIPTTPAGLWSRVRGFVPSFRQATQRTDGVGRLLGHIPSAFADHFMDRYLETVDRSG